MSEVKIDSQDAEEPEEAHPDGDEASPEGAETAEGGEGSELEALRAERDKVKDQLLRTAADFDNYRKRARKDVEQAERRGKEEVLRELLPIIDNLERAVAASADAKDVEAVRDGVQMVLKGFDDTASRIGLTRVESVGQRFDPNVHDAFQQQETDEHPPGTIVAEYQPGYMLGDRLLRPAMVVVARKPAEGGGE
ncbi:MAG TPA: nucleotide exchange factor GrpE [Sandaracinaceae bacterium LLY-WYZ-13_1]|nr:nucleotide exchange factor GrpE [Sandaracinaceae bacterium LLY-WYZ-13_1]